MLPWFVGLFALGCGIVGGVFFGFSSFVLRALSGLEAPAGVAAMQRINVVVVNPLFLGVFVGTAVLGVVCAVGALLAWPAGRGLLLVSAALLYGVGSFGVTVAFNVPRNERLARLGDSTGALAYWPTYVREWGRWNHVRTAASVAACAVAVAAVAS